MNVYNNVSGVGTGYETIPYEGFQKASDETLVPMDSYVPGEKGKNYVYQNPSIKRMWDEANSATIALRNFVQSMLGGQKVNGNAGQGYWGLIAETGKLKIEVEVEVDEATRLEAEAMIAEDGYFGVKQTTGRIMDFAKALAGNNVSLEEIANLRDGAQKGFDATAEMFGGWENVPEVTKQTYKAVMDAFDAWSAELTPADVSQDAATAPAIETPEVTD